MTPTHESRSRRFVVACTVLGLAAASGCGSDSQQNTGEAPKSRLSKRLEVLQEKKNKSDKAK